MPKKPETKFREKVRPQLDSLPHSWWESIQQKAIRGTPDIVGCINGQFIALELKSSKKATLAPLQAYKLERIQKAGGVSVVVYPENWEELFTELKKIAYSEGNDRGNGQCLN